MANTWAEELIKQLEEKRIVLQQQLDGVTDAIRALRQGYDIPVMRLPNVLNGPSVKALESRGEEEE